VTWLGSSIAQLLYWLGPVALIELFYLAVKRRGNLQLAHNVRRGAYIIFLISLGVDLNPALAKHRWLILEPMLLIFFLYVAWNEVPLRRRQPLARPQPFQPADPPENKPPTWTGFS
jgi:hypothetical protein